MINVNDIKTGMTLIIEGNIYQIVDFLHVKPGKGSAFMKTKLKNLRTGGTIERTFNTNVKFEKANINRSSVQYLYNTGDTYCFMNMVNIQINKLVLCTFMLCCNYLSLKLFSFIFTGKSFYFLNQLPCLLGCYKL